MIKATAGTSSLGSSSKHLRSHEDKETVALSGGALLLASAFGNGLNYVLGYSLLEHSVRKSSASTL